MSDQKPCPGCGWPRARLFGRTKLRENESGLVTYDEYMGHEYKIVMRDFRYGFYYRCNKCGWKSPIVWTPWHIRTEEETDSWCRDAMYFGFEQDSEWARPYREKALELWNIRYENTCHVEDWKDEPDSDDVTLWLSCGHEISIDRDFLPIQHCIRCGSKVIGDS